jgi:hypothetical protein
MIISIIVCTCIGIITAIVATVFYRLYLKEKETLEIQMECSNSGELKMVEINENDIRVPQYDIEEFDNNTEEIDLNNNDLV